MKDISRIDFLKGSVAAAAALGLTGIAPAFAEEAKTEEKEKLVPSSTVDCDAVVVGAGAAGLMAAMELAAAGKKNVQVIGDCRSVGNLRTVIWGAYEAAMKV